MDQIRRMVDDGTLLNYDACVQNPRVWGFAAADRVPGDDPGLNKTRFNLCTNFYKTGSWRGGISPGIDDRKDALAAEWTPERRRQFVTIRDDLAGNFNNAMNVVRSRTGAAALDYPGAAKEVETAKGNITSYTSRLASEGQRVDAYVKAMQKSQNVDLINRVSEKEQVIRKLEKENNKYKFHAEAAKEQANSLYNKYEGNQHSMIFGYAPWEIYWSYWYTWVPYNPYVNLNPTTRSGLLFLAFFFGFLAIIVVGVKTALAYAAFKATGGVLFSSVGMSGLFGPGMLSGVSQVSAFRPNPGRIMPDVLRF